MRDELRWFACVMLLCGLARGGSPEMCVVVAVNHQAGFEETMVAKAEGIAAGIFRRLGIQVEWHAKAGAQGSDLLVNLVREDSSVMGANGTGLAALPERGRMGYLIYVFRPRLEQLDNEYRIRHGLGASIGVVVLGYVMAHEMAHQLLASSQHSNGGIMKACWDRSDIHLALTGGLRFSPEQSGRIREAVRARNALPYRACAECRD